MSQVLRDGKWREEEAAILVPGDIISIKLGDIIPADARLLEGDPLKIDQVLNMHHCLSSNFLPRNLLGKRYTCPKLTSNHRLKIFYFFP